MKILFVTDLYPIKPDEKVSVRALHNFAFQWVQSGHEVLVVKPNFVLNSYLRKKPFYKTGFYEFEGVNIFNVNYHLPFLGKIEDKIADKIDVSSFDIIISHMPSGIILANKIAKIYKKPLVCAVHVSDLEVLTNPLYRFYFRGELQDAYKNSQKIACRSFVLQRKFSKILPELADKTFVASSGVEVGTQRDLQFTINNLPLTIFTCANLIKRKNIDKLILAIRDLEGFTLKIIGDGAEMKSLRKLKAPNVEFLGKLEHEKVLEEMRKSDVFVLPSVNETFGLVYLEAMASGCATVGVKNEGVDGIIVDGENGFLIEPNVEAIREVLLRIKNYDNIDELRQKGFETACKYSIEACAESYLKNITQ